jgi:VWFA-related protein
VDDFRKVIFAFEKYSALNTMRNMVVRVWWLPLLALACFSSCSVLAQTSQASPDNSNPVIKSSVHEVLVPVAVRDNRGEAIGDLKQEDFQVFDNGKAQAITGFTMVERAAANSTSPESSRVAAQPSPTQQRFIALVFDNLNSTTGDLAMAQDAALKVMGSPLPGSDMVAVLSTSGTNSGLTHDREKIAQAIRDLKVNDRFVPRNAGCPTLDYHQADLIVNKGDGMALGAAVEEVLKCTQTGLPSNQATTAPVFVERTAEHVLAMGSQNTLTNLLFLRTVLSKMGRLPGQRILILVSSGGAASELETALAESQVMDLAAQGNVVINVIDAGGLSVANVGGLIPNAGLLSVARGTGQNGNAFKGYNEDILADLAEGTGGIYFHNSNDLEGGLRKLVSGPRFLYLLSFSIANVKPDGAYHRLKVKINRDGLTLEARHDYVAPKEEKKK